jgi:hypothetical protein
LFTTHTERRRNSLERAFKGDYIGYRENFLLKAIVESHGKEKLHFGDRVNKYDRRGNKQRRIFLFTDQAAYLISIEKNMDQDKIKRAQKPWVYLEKRRIPLNMVRGFVLSPYAGMCGCYCGGCSWLQLIYAFPFFPLQITSS